MPHKTSLERQHQLFEESGFVGRAALNTPWCQRSGSWEQSVGGRIWTERSRAKRKGTHHAPEGTRLQLIVLWPDYFWLVVRLIGKT